MKETLRAAGLMLAVLSLLTGVLYPVAVTIVAQAAFPELADGSLVRRGDRLVGSRLVGQSFSRPDYFWGRLSATGPVAYNAAASSGSNLGPLNPALAESVRGRIEALRAADPGVGDVPVDLVTASGSGLDPHISPEAAELQVPRVARERGRSEDDIRRLVARYREGRQFGMLGEPTVNVLLLNLALDVEMGAPVAGR